jgi:hypothetical protein
MESPEKVLSPFRPRERRHGGRRSGAGRKKKATPVKKIRKSDLAFERRKGPKGGTRKKWLKAQNDLVSYIRSHAELGEEYREIYDEYVRLGKSLGQSGLRFELPDPEKDPEPTDEAADDGGGQLQPGTSRESDSASSSSEDSPRHLKVWCLL